LEEGGIHIQNVENRSLYWDIQFIYETDSRFEVVDAQMGSVKNEQLWIAQDTGYDTSESSVDIYSLGYEINQKKSLSLGQIIITVEDGNTILDTLGPVGIFDSPRHPVYYVLGFWNVFSADTAAQALRDWDGAHIGPSSGRTRESF